MSYFSSYLYVSINKNIYFSFLFFFVFLHAFVLIIKTKQQNDRTFSSLFFLDMDNDDCHSLYKNSSITLFESYIAIEKFIIDTRLSFIDQYKLFDLLKKLLPHEENQLTCQGFLSWLVWRVDQYEEEQQQERPVVTDKRSYHDTSITENGLTNKRLRTSKKNRSSRLMNTTITTVV